MWTLLSMFVFILSCRSMNPRVQLGGRRNVAQAGKLCSTIFMSCFAVESIESFQTPLNSMTTMMLLENNGVRTFASHPLVRHINTQLRVHLYIVATWVSISSPVHGPVHQWCLLKNLHTGHHRCEVAWEARAHAQTRPPQNSTTSTWGNFNVPLDGIFGTS